MKTEIVTYRQYDSAFKRIESANIKLHQRSLSAGSMRNRAVQMGLIIEIREDHKTLEVKADWRDQIKREFLQPAVGRVHPEEIIGNDASQIAARKSKYGRREWVVWRGKDGNQHAAPRTLETLKAAMLAHGTQNTFTCYNAGVAQLTDWHIANNMRRQIQMGYIS